MTELERKALLGDREVQRICTEKGIVLSCPFCGGNTSNTDGTIFKIRNSNLYAHKRTGKCLLDGEIIYSLSDWNTRPPVGMCKECQHYVAEWVGDGESIPAECIHPLTGLLIISDDDFCSYFEPKEGEGND